MPSPDKSFPDWVDITSPPPPTSELDLWLVMVILGLISIFILGLAYWWRRPRRVALRQLKHLSATPGDGRQRLLALRRILQQGLGVAHLQQVRLDGHLQDEWQQFYHELTHLSYGTLTPDADRVLHMQCQSREWLMRVPTA